jgi:hypothetical protein
MQGSKNVKMRVSGQLHFPARVPPGTHRRRGWMGPIFSLGVLEERKLPLSLEVIEPQSLERVARSLDTIPTAMARLSIVCRVTEADICGYGSAQVTVCNYTVRYLLIFNVVFLFGMESEWVRPLQMVW